MSKRDLRLYFSDGMRYTPLRLAVFDFLLLNISFFIVNYTKQGSFDIPVGYDMLLFLFYVCWLVSGLVGKKFLPSRYQGLRAGSGVLLKSILYLIYLIVFSVVIFGLSRYSRVQVFATCSLFFGLEILLLFVLSRYVSPVKDVDLEADMDPEVTAFQKSTFSYRFLGLDLLLLVGAFFIVNFMKRGHLTLLPSYEFLLLTLIGLWFGVSLSTRKFNLIGQKNLYFAIWQWIKSGFLMMAVTGVLVFGLRMFQYSRFQGFGTIVLLMGLELLALLVYFSARKEKRTDSDIDSVDQVRQMLNQEAYDLNVDVETVRRRLMEPCTHKLARHFHTENLPFFDFLDEYVKLKEILCMEALVDRSCDPFTLRDDHFMLRLFISLQRINNCRRINAHFLQLHQMLLPGGYFAGYAHTIKTHRDWMYDKFPRQMAHVIYGLDFLVNRVAPKLPWIQKVYFALTKGKNRILSRAEVLGRLCFCGFEIVATRVIDNRFYFIARKVKTSSLDTSPTYGPLVALKRSGYGGQVVHTYK